MQQSADAAVTTISWNDIPKALDIENPDSEAGRVFHRVLAVTAENSGYPVWWGRTLEDPEKVVLLMTFKNLDDRIAAGASEWRRSCRKDLMSISTGYPHIVHVEFDEAIVPALTCPVTTLASALFDASESSEDLRDGFEDYFQRYQASLSIMPGGQLAGIYVGWTMEDDVPYTGLSDGKDHKGKAFVMASGWNSPDEMMAYHTSEHALSLSAGILEVVGGWYVQNIKFNVKEPEAESA